ncbi:MAG: LPS export ABC transporter ATP-binding protein [Devosiaceae bacterium]|nr:LPS export ABC transporter ATP-binding protein [Devosiaceae bacterium MH13]
MLARMGVLVTKDPVERLGRQFDRSITRDLKRNRTASGKTPASADAQVAQLDAVPTEPAVNGAVAPEQAPDLPPLTDEETADMLVVRGLRKAYRGRTVVSDAALSLKRGEAVGLLGPNGAGKTTIFYMITGLVLPDVGQILIDGQDVTHLPMYQRARLGIGYLPQEASIFRGMTVAENILAVLELVEPDAKKRQNDLDALLEEFNISHLRDTASIALSGGERRRCEIARALASRPAYMLLDEPFAGVDPIAVGDIRNLVRHLTTRGIGVLITDHNVRETLNLIDRATIIHSGRVLTEGTPQSIIADPEARRLYLGEGFTL